MPHVEIPQAEFKVVVLGDSHVGKTSLVTRFAEGYYREGSRPATVGAFFVTKRIQSSGSVPTKIQIWDTAGQDAFRAMAPAFYRNAAAVIVCYDATRRESFEGMRRWLDEVRASARAGAEVVVAIAALKTDLVREENGKRVPVPEREAEQLAEALGVVFLPTSAKTNRNVNALFQCVADRVLQLQANIDEGAGATTNGEGGTGGSTPRSNYRHTNGSSNNSNSSNNNNNNVAEDERIKSASPRKRDQFDKYYASNGDGTDGGGRRSKDRSAPAIDKDASASEKSLQGSGRRKPRGDGAITASTDGTTVASDEGSHQFLENNKKDKKKKKKPKEESLCVDEAPFMSCAPSCGAGDGGYGCAVM